MELVFDLGIKEYNIKGANGETTIRFNPTDANFARRAYEAFKVLEDKQKKRAELINENTSNEDAFEFTKKIDDEMRATIDELFGYPVCEAIFGTINLYSMAGFSPVCLNFMSAVLDQFDEGVKRERYLVSEKAKKYTNKYVK